VLELELVQQRVLEQERVQVLAYRKRPGQQQRSGRPERRSSSFQIS
jgi:hypothetical protein